MEYTHFVFEPHILCYRLDDFEHAYTQDDILKVIENV